MCSSVGCESYAMAPAEVECPLSRGTDATTSGQPLRRRKQQPNEAKKTWGRDIKPPTGGTRESMPTALVAFFIPDGSGYSLVLGLAVGSILSSAMRRSPEENG